MANGIGTRSLVGLPLKEAQFCASCGYISNASKRCPACEEARIMKLETLMVREEVLRAYEQKVIDGQCNPSD